MAEPAPVPAIEVAGTNAQDKVPAALAYLQKAASDAGGNVYDHLTDVLSKVRDGVLGRERKREREKGR